MQIDLDDTIAALASAAGSAARGIIRLSGGEVQTVLDAVFTPNESGWPGLDRREAPDVRPEKSQPDTRFLVAQTPELRKDSSPGHPLTARRHTGHLHLTAFRSSIPTAVYLWPTARSYTGQPSAELHLPGSPPLLEALLAELYSHGARPAQPGEFTMRAFLSGRIDLVQAEAVLGVIDADDQPRLKTALAQLAGGISGRIDAVQSDLLNLLADLEAGLDFVEDDIEFVSRDELVRRISSAQEIIERLLEQSSSRMLSTGRRNVVIAGLPNAGKSTLFNALAGRESALVSNVRGTTRDYLSAECDWNGTAVNLIDTAGWEQGDDELTAEAQRKRLQRISQAELVLWCTASDLDGRELAIDRHSRQELDSGQSPVLQVRTKADLAADKGDAVGQVVTISVTAGTGLQELIAGAIKQLSGEATEGQELVGTTAARCRESLQSAYDSLGRAHAVAAIGEGEEVIAIDLREVLEHLGRILGRVYTDDILDRLFSRFCIGK